MSSVHAFFAEIQLVEGRDLKTAIFQKNCLKFSDFKKKTEKRTKIEDQEGEVGKIFLNTTSANLLCTSSTLGLHGKPRINYQQHGPSFRLKNNICVLSSVLLRIVGRMRCEHGLTSECCYNIVRNTLIMNMTKPGKWVFCLSDFHTAVQQKLISTIWSFFIETYPYTYWDLASMGAFVSKNWIDNEWSWSKLSVIHTSVIFGIIQATENNDSVNDALLWFLYLCLNVNIG